DNGQFTVSLSALSSTDTTISYTVSGTAAPGSDYTALAGSVTIPAGSLTALVDVTLLADTLVEGDETVIVTLTAVTSGDPQITLDSGNSAATVTIADTEDTALVSITANDPSAAEPADNGQFTVSLSALSSTDTTISYVLTGSTATAGSDYVALSGSVTIPAGSLTALIDVTLLADSLVEGDETVIVTLTAVTSGDPQITLDSGNSAATVTIADTEDTALVSITANDPSAAEPADNGQFTVSLSALSSTDTTISYVLTGSTATAGSDYVALAGSVTIPAGSLTALIDVTLLADSLVEGDETVIVTLTAVTSGDPQITLDSGNSAATVTIADTEDTALVSITANDPSAAEPADNGQFTVSLSALSSTDTTISYVLTGSTATAGSDYVALSGSVTIPAGSLTALVDVTLLADTLVEGDETVIVTLTAVTAG